MILAIDPGTVESGWCIYSSKRVIASGVEDNHAILRMVKDWNYAIAIEMIASYGMPVGKETFETVVWIGRFIQAFVRPIEVRLVFRKEVKLFLCGSLKAKDPNVRQALLDMFPTSGGGKTPQIGVKAKPGPLFGVSSHAWSALAVAVTAEHQIGIEHRSTETELV